MALSFPAPVGAAADMKELEYIAALHQTSKNVDKDFMNGSIEAQDIKYYLISRFGIDVSIDHIRSTIIKDFGGAGNDIDNDIQEQAKDEPSSGGKDFEDCLDIVEIIAILIIPTLLAYAQLGDGGNVNHNKTRDDFLTSWGYKNYLDDLEEIEKSRPADTLIADVLRTILVDVTGSSKPPKITKELIIKIFSTYDELELVQNETLLNEMIQVASGGKSDAVLDVEAFKRALTDDVRKYDFRKEMSCTTIVEDVFDTYNRNELHAIFEKNKGSTTSDEEGVALKKEAEAEGPNLMFTFPSIDLTAQTFRSDVQSMSVMVAVLFSYLSFFYGREGYQVCSTGTIGCQIANSTCNWLIIMCVLTVPGSLFCILLNLGNHTYETSIYKIVAGMLSVILFFWIPTFVQFDAMFFGTKDPDYMDTADGLIKWIYFTLGVLVWYSQIINMIRHFIPEEKLTANPILSYIFSGSTVKSEYSMKQASKFKIQKMIKNAHDLHSEDFDEAVTQRNVIKREIVAGIKDKDAQPKKQKETSTNAIALLNFTKVQEMEEIKGGFLWAWKNFISGDLLDREGVWIQSRFIAGNTAQFILLIVLFGYAASYLQILSILLGGLYPDYQGNTGKLDWDLECVPLFNSSTCYFPQIPQIGAMGIAICPEVYFPDDGGCVGKLQVSQGGFIDQVCDILSEIEVFNSTEECLSVEFLNTTTNIYADDYGGIESAVELGFDEETSTICSAPVNYCVPMNETVMSCVLGLDHFYHTPYAFFGDICTVTPVIETFQGKSTMEIIMRWVPRHWMVTFSVSMGIIFSFGAGLIMSVIVIPSTVASTLKFRLGIFSTLRGKNFNKYRTQIEDTTFLLGLMFWGTMFSAVILLVIVSLIFFLLVWQVTRPLLVQVAGIVIGISVTLVLKMILVKCLIDRNYVGYYRKRPARGNLYGLALECWHLGLTVGYMLARMIKILIASSMYIGRVDTPILADGTLGDALLDKFPHSYRKGILSGEAHRHPYIERLGTMYLMKLRYEDEFGKPSGSVWRLLFVFALMPWMRKYRILDDDDEMLLEKFSLKKKVDDDGAKQKNV